MSTDTLEHIDVESLEEVWNEDHCEANHFRTVCAHTPVATLHTCRVDGVKVCKNIVDDVAAQYRAKKRCATCKRLISDCWRTEPI